MLQLRYLLRCGGITCTCRGIVGGHMLSCCVASANLFVSLRGRRKHWLRQPVRRHKWFLLLCLQVAHHCRLQGAGYWRTAPPHLLLFSSLSPSPTAFAGRATFACGLFRHCFSCAAVRLALLARRVVGAGALDGFLSHFSTRRRYAVLPLSQSLDLCTASGPEGATAVLPRKLTQRSFASHRRGLRSN